MQWLNHQHLLYFWVAAQEGSVTGAAARLRLAPSTVSAQIKLLEEQVDHALLHRSGRRLVPTAQGKIVAEYARDIFGLDQELRQVLSGQGDSRHRVRFRVGLGNTLPKFLGHAVLSRARVKADGEPLHLVVHQGSLDWLVAELSLHHLDLALTDQPVATHHGGNLRSVFLGESPIAIFGTAALVDRFGDDLPQSLAGAPFLLPEPRSVMRRLLEEWFVEQGIQPQVEAEFIDSGMLKLFGEDGRGFFAAPAVVSGHVRHTHRVEELMLLGGRGERFYALTRPELAGSTAIEAMLAAARALLGSLA
jgi:LysR family transcriptional regulator, transcriptional activator of nhaA